MKSPGVEGTASSRGAEVPPCFDDGAVGFASLDAGHFGEDAKFQQAALRFRFLDFEQQLSKVADVANVRNVQDYSEETQVWLRCLCRSRCHLKDEARERSSSSRLRRTKPGKGLLYGCVSMKINKLSTSRRIFFSYRTFDH